MNINESEPLTLRSLLEDQVRSGKESVLYFDNRPFTVGALYVESLNLAGYLRETLNPGDRVAVMARNGRTAVISWWACNLAELIVVPINTGNRGEILDHQFGETEPGVVVVEREFAAEVLGSLTRIGSHSSVVAVECTGGEPCGGESCGLCAPLRVSRTFVPRDEDKFAPSHIIYTSGTTGPSKGCIVSHAYMANLAKQMTENIQRLPGDTLWTALPLFHLNALGHVIGTLTLGADMSIASRFSLTGFWDDILTSQARVASLMGSMLHMVAAAGESESSRRARGQLTSVTGSPVTEELVQTWRERFDVPRVGSGAYGMTEASLITATSATDYRPGTAGRLNDCFEIRIADESGHAVGRGQPGEILARPLKPGIMFDGYWRQPEKTLAVYRNLWFHTGDIGRFDEDGCLIFVDRGKDYMRRGGENISSYEMEKVLIQHSDIAEVAVHAVAADHGEDDVKVTAVLEPGSTLSNEQLLDWINGKVPRYAMPSYIEFRESLPKNQVGRVLKHELRSEGVTAGSWATDWRARYAS